MNIKQLKTVMKKYGKAWQNKNSKLILECFTKNGTYRESPFARPYRGHKEIEKFWDTTVVRDQKSVRFKLGKCQMSKNGKTGFAEWQCSNVYKGKPHRMVGIMIIEMNGNKISRLNEYWNTKRG